MFGPLADRDTRRLAFFGSLDLDRRLGVFFVRRPGLAAAAGADSYRRKNRSDAAKPRSFMNSPQFQMRLQGSPVPEPLFFQQGPVGDRQVKGGHCD